MVARAQRMRARMLAAREAHRLPLLAKEAQRWTFLAAVPPREVFAVMEQMLGSFPFRFELTGESSARIVEFRRKGLVGQWSKRVAIHTRWVTCEARPTASGTVVTVVASRGRGPVPRALQLVQLLSRGSADPRTIYRRRAMPSGPVSLVASWAGMPYRLYTEPRWEAPRGARVLTATGVEAMPGVKDPRKVRAFVVAARRAAGESDDVEVSELGVHKPLSPEEELADRKSVV